MKEFVNYFTAVSVGPDSVLGYLDFTGYIDLYNNPNSSNPVGSFLQSATNVDGSLSAEGNNVIYRDKQYKLWLYPGTGAPLNLSSNVTGGFPKIYNNGVFWSENTGNTYVIWTYDISTAVKTKITYANGTDALMYAERANFTGYQNTVYFAADNGYIRQINLATLKASQLTAEAAPFTPSTGFLDVNKATGVIYYGDEGINQIYFDGLKARWNTKPVASNGANQSGYMLYSYPNVFYIDKYNKIATAYFPTGNCDPVVQRKGQDALDNAITPPVAVSSFTLIPNPAVALVNIHFSLENEGDAKLQILNSLGTEVVDQELGYFAVGDNVSQIDLNTLSSGVYFVQAYLAGERIGVQKLVITK